MLIPAQSAWIYCSYTSSDLLGFEVPALRHSSRDYTDITVVAVRAEIVAQVVAVSDKSSTHRIKVSHGRWPELWPGSLEERDGGKSPSAPRTQTSLSRHLAPQQGPRTRMNAASPSACTSFGSRVCIFNFHSKWT